MSESSVLSENTAHIRQVITDLERARCKALVEQDLAMLASLVADDVVHIHASGRAEGKEAYLGGVRSRLRFHTSERPSLDIRVLGDAVIVTGPLRQSIEVVATGQRVEMSAIATQVWTRRDGHWRQVSFQATSVG